MIPQSFIQDLLNRVDIVSVVERYVPLKKAGANYVACCPFHNEKSPSFTVSPTKQFYHCFGCGAHGTAIGFVMEHTGAGFIDAVKDLAQSVGMTVPDVREDKTPARHVTQEGEDLYDVMTQAAQYYAKQLKDSTRAIEYLKKRGLSGAIARDFGIGYAPNDWRNLEAVFPKYESEALTAAGLVIQGDGDKRYDRFRDRIMFPIVDTRGRIIGFGGRIIDQGEPKYLNSPETALFQKGQELYGFFQARRAIRDAGRVMVVEGYMDVVALAQSGIGYAVATLGTATTPTHVQKLLRQTDEIVFCFDGDDAGRRAAWRALENSLAHIADGKRIQFLFLPQGEDPDTYVRQIGKDAFEKLLAGALPLSGFLLQELIARTDLRTPEGRAQLLKEAQPLVTQIAAPMLSLLLRKELAQKAGVTQEELDAQYQITAPKIVKTPARAPRDRRVLTSERVLLQCLFAEPALSAKVPESCLGGENREAKFLTSLLEFLGESAVTATSAIVLQHYAGGEYDDLMQELERAVAEWGEDYDVPAQFAGAVENLQRQHPDAQRALQALLEKGRQGVWTPEENAQFQQLLKAKNGK